MENSRWQEIKRHLELLLDNEVRVFSAADVERFSDFLADPDPHRGARNVAQKLASHRLGGDLDKWFSTHFEGLLGVQLPPSNNAEIRPANLDQWVTAPEATTMERPLSRPSVE